MKSQFPDANITKFDSRIEHMCVDPGDRHVVAAAVQAGASIIVTSNIRHFPDSDLRPLKIEAQSIDTFLMMLYRDAPTTVEEIINAQASALQRPPLTVTEVLDTLALHAPNFVLMMQRTLKGST